jgi:transcriptional regulator with PAS, ATPase and Fis domain
MLRVLQEGTFLPVGGTVVRKVDVRVIAATNRDLKAMVREGSFREDLYYRLNVINLVVPSLRERREDIPALADHFFARTVRRMNIRPKGLAAETLRRLVAHDWPGNVRELENEVERLVVLAGDGAEVGPELLSPKLRGLALSAEADPNAELPDALEALERKMLLDGLKKANWNKTRAAAELGISRRNLIRKVERYQLDKQRSAPS